MSPDSPITMGQILSIPGLLLGLYGLYWAYKHRLPAGWVEPGDERDDDAEAEEESSPADDEDEDEDEDDAEERDDEAEDSDKVAGDPDVDAEFEDGKLKKAAKPTLE